jgi:hypothetical protein
LDEDKIVLELQMKALVEENPANFPPLAIRADEAPIRARRMLSKRVRAEAEDSTTIVRPIRLAADPPV